MIFEGYYLEEFKVGISVHSCIEIEQLKIFGIEMGPLENSKSYQNLVNDGDILKISNLANDQTASYNSKKIFMGVFERDMYKYKIHKQDQAKFYLQFNFAPKRVNLRLPGEFELVKIKSNGVNLIRIYILKEQVQIDFHPLYNARNTSLISSIHLRMQQEHKKTI